MQTFMKNQFLHLTTKAFFPGIHVDARRVFRTDVVLLNLVEHVIMEDHSWEVHNVTNIGIMTPITKDLRPGEVIMLDETYAIKRLTEIVRHNIELFRGNNPTRFPESVWNHYYDRLPEPMSILMDNKWRVNIHYDYRWMFDSTPDQNGLS